MSRKCRKCGNKIPNRIKIGEQYKVLNSRKFCLVCSPWGKHNTSPNDPFLRIRSKKGTPYCQYTEAEKEMVTLSLYKRGLTRKKNLITLKGNKCQSCGYDKSWKALSFHHRDPSSKKYGLTLNILWSRPWEEILLEVDKCDLLCLNCHAEIGHKTKSNIVLKINQKYGTNF